ncbi:MAG: noranthrone monooxygenase [Lasallia pustulata]|uniref:Noranthrone monooxygenase n=1 Tax=Lasallia pustulata TaxID=136370 RepID=A0A5M8PSR5_9LECA|nr:MAG: noranthrone monooxygenase [Lasallia pustulata]
MARQAESEAPKIGVQATALVTASFLSGAMMSLSAIVVPVFLDTDTESTHLVRQWARLYHYGHLYMPAVSVAATGLYGYVALRKRASNRNQWFIYAAAGATTITMVPFTWLMMAPTNTTLFRLEALASATASAVELSTVQELVVRWAWLHVVRSVFPLVGAILGLVGVLQ